MRAPRRRDPDGAALRGSLEIPRRLPLPRSPDLAVAAACAIVMVVLAMGGFLRDPKQDVRGALLCIAVFLVALVVAVHALFDSERGWRLRVAPAGLLAAAVLILFCV